MSSQQKPPRYKHVFAVLAFWFFLSLLFMATSGLVPKTALAWALMFVLGPVLYLAGEALVEGVRSIWGDAGVLLLLFAMIVPGIFWYAYASESRWLESHFHQY